MRTKSKAKVKPYCHCLFVKRLPPLASATKASAITYHRAEDPLPLCSSEGENSIIRFTPTRSLSWTCSFLFHRVRWKLEKPINIIPNTSPTPTCWVPLPREKVFFSLSGREEWSQLLSLTSSLMTLSSLSAELFSHGDWSHSASSLAPFPIADGVVLVKPTIGVLQKAAPKQQQVGNL